MISVEPLKAFDDNYIWLVTTNEGSIVIDPGESSKIIELIDRNEINLKGILICLLYTSPSPRDATLSRMPSSA